MKSAYIKYLFALLLFGSNGVVASFIPLSSYEIVFLRTGIGSLLLVAIFFLTGQKITCLENKRYLLYLAISGAAMGASWILLYEAYQQIGVSISSLLYYCGPVIIMILSPILFQERLTKVKVIGFLTVLCGVALINLQTVSGGKTAWGLFCAGMSAVMYAIMVIFNKKSTSITGLENATFQLVISFLTVAVFVFWKQGFSMQIDSGTWVPILILGVLNTGFGCYCYFSAIGRLPVQTVAVCGYLEPLSAVLFAMLFLHEAMRPIQMIGVVLILGGAIVGEGLFQRKQRHERSLLS